MVVTFTGDSAPVTGIRGDTEQVAASSSVGSPWSWFGSHDRRHRGQRGSGTPTASPTATPSTTPSADSTSTKPPAGTPGPASGSGTPGEAGPGGSGSTTAPVSVGDFPTAATTGVAAGTSLKSYSGDMTVTKSGTTVSGYDISGGLYIKGDNITVKDVRVRCAGVNDFCVGLLGTGDTLDRADVGGGADGSTPGNAIGIWAGGDTGSAASTQITRTNVHHTSDGLRIDGSTTVSDSFIHELSYANGAHSDGTQNTSGANVIFRHNTFIGATNCTIFLQPSGETPIANIVIDQNQLIGEARNGQISSYGICVDRRVSRVSVTNNRFSRTGWMVGPATEGFPWAVWSGNAWQDGATLSRA